MHGTVQYSMSTLTKFATSRRLRRQRRQPAQRPVQGSSCQDPPGPGATLARAQLHPVLWSQLTDTTNSYLLSDGKLAAGWVGVADEIVARVHEKAAEIESGNGRGA